MHANAKARRRGREKPAAANDATRPNSRPGRRLPPEVLTDTEVCRLLKACSARAATGVRHRALLTVLYRAGLRINEALHLLPKDLDLAGGALRVLHGKGGTSRTVGLDPGAAAIVQRWLDLRSRRGLNGRAPVFCTLTGRPISASYIRVLLKRLGRKAGIEKRVHAHGLRHTHAAQLRAEGVDIGIISRQLGHASISTTARYLDHIAPQAVIRTMQARAWTPAPSGATWPDAPTPRIAPATHIGSPPGWTAGVALTFG